MTIILLFILVLGLSPILIEGIQESATFLLHTFETALALVGLVACLVMLAGVLWVMWEIRQPIFRDYIPHASGALR